MLPLDRRAQVFSLPRGDRHSAVVFTGPADRPLHLHLVRRCELKFPGLIQQWYALDASENAPAARGLRWRDRLTHGVTGASRARRFGDVLAAEQSIFETEPAPPTDRVSPIRITDPTTPTVLEELRRIAPYVVISCGAVAPLPALGALRGMALNLCVGWMPDYAGPHAIEWALFDGRLDGIGSTVTRTATDGSQSILRRSNATIPDDSTPAECVARASALGVELILEVLSDVLAADTMRECAVSELPNVPVRPQFGEVQRAAVTSRFGGGWLRAAAQEIRRY